MSSLWWLALPVLLLPIWWHRQRRERTHAIPLATARFLPSAQPRHLRVWRWRDRVLLLVRCLLLVCLIAFLAGLVLPWRGDSVLVAPGADPAWLERQVAETGFMDARRINLPDGDALAWLALHEREWRPGARLLVAGAIPMPAVLPRFRHRVELRTRAVPLAGAEHRVAIVSKRADKWRALFGAVEGAQRYLATDTPGPQSELIVWDLPEAPPGAMRAPLWWVTDPDAFPELRGAPVVDGIRYADSAHGRLWSSAAWPPADPDAARALFETWQQLHYPPVAFTAPSQVLKPAPMAPTGGSLRELLLAALAVLFALERILAHASRR